MLDPSLFTAVPESEPPISDGASPLQMRALRVAERAYVKERVSTRPAVVQARQSVTLAIVLAREEFRACLPSYLAHALEFPR